MYLGVEENVGYIWGQRKKIVGQKEVENKK